MKKYVVILPKECSNISAFLSMKNATIYVHQQYGCIVKGWPELHDVAMLVMENGYVHASRWWLSDSLFCMKGEYAVDYGEALKKILQHAKPPTWWASP